VSKITDGSLSGSSLEGKRDPYAHLYTGHVNDKANEADSVKTTMIMRSVANPRRTTLAHLKDADELTVASPVERAETGKPVAGLPAQTANPRRTVLVDAPVG
jgi:hypothetical protein